MAELAEKNAKLKTDVARLEAMGVEVPDLREKVHAFSIYEQLLHRHVQRFRGGLVFKALLNLRGDGGGGAGSEGEGSSPQKD